jgi:hypothetical protein
MGFNCRTIGLTNMKSDSYIPLYIKILGIENKKSLTRNYDKLVRLFGYTKKNLILFLIMFVVILYYLLLFCLMILIFL